jgi:hypothetical protein
MGDEHTKFTFEIPHNYKECGRNCFSNLSCDYFAFTRPLYKFTDLRDIRFNTSVSFNCYNDSHNRKMEENKHVLFPAKIIDFRSHIIKREKEEKEKKEKLLLERVLFLSRFLPD